MTAEIRETVLSRFMPSSVIAPLSPKKRLPLSHEQAGIIAQAQEKGLNKHVNNAENTPPRTNAIIQPISDNVSTQALSPVHKLPPELLGQIFIHAVAIVDTRMGTRMVMVPPLSLCQISRLWREVAVSLPQLWQKFTLYYQVNTAVERAKCWLARASAAYPATVEIKKSFNLIGRGPPRTEYFEQFASIVGSFVFNWHNTDHSDTSYTRFFPRSAAVSYPLLRRLTILGGKSGLSHHHIFDMKDAMKDTIPWSQLTHLNITQRLSIITGSEVISLCTNLLKCRMYFACTTQSFLDPPAESRISPSLRTLIAYIFPLNTSPDNTPSAYSHLFDMLNLPALKNLHLHVNHLKRDIDGRFTAFKERSSLDLESFSLQDPDADISGLALAEFLKDMPSLSTIDIKNTNYTITSIFFRELSRRDNASDLRLAPNLRVLNYALTSRPEDDTWITELYNMLDSRCPPETRQSPAETYLETVQLRLARLPPEYHHDALRLLRQGEAWTKLGMCFDLLLL